MKLVSSISSVLFLLLEPVFFFVSRTLFFGWCCFSSFLVCLVFVVFFFGWCGGLLGSRVVLFVLMMYLSLVVAHMFWVGVGSYQDIVVLKTLRNGFQFHLKDNWVDDVNRDLWHEMWQLIENNEVKSILKHSLVLFGWGFMRLGGGREVGEFAFIFAFVHFHLDIWFSVL